MNSIGTIIATNRKKQKMSQIDLARELNQRFGHEVSNKSVSKWEKDDTTPSIQIFYDICRLLGITNMYEAYFDENPDDPLSVLNETGKEKVYEYVALLSLDERYQKPKPADNIIPFRTIPLQLYPVSAGPGNFLDEECYEPMPVGKDVPLSTDFAVRVSGDSMEPKLHKNQIIYIHNQETLENGEIGIFFLNGEAFVKKFQNDRNGTFLISLNKKYDPIEVITGSEFRIFGKMVGVKSSG